MFKKKLKICYFNHPQRKGFAKLAKLEHMRLAGKLGLPFTVDSAMFEKIVANTNGVEIYWKS